ncbi:MAG TPA: NADP-dependent oxidoreductase [Candidatus Limnocylindrales bacterium]|nr:NADP-dependent oxidoreductase [Candidatus Limnocylindrales bacterium]
MKAVLVTRFGGPEVLRVAEVERPAPISTEVLVRVLAAGINPVDWKTRRGDGVARWVGPPPFIPGWDVAGVVEAMGYGVTRFKVGDLVFGMPWFPRAAGAYAEYVTAPSRQLARVPDGVSPIQAAAVPLAWLTAFECLIDTANVVSGQTVVVHGAAGGVGHIAVQIAEARGARVVSTTGRHDREALQTRDVDVALDLVGDDIAGLLGTLRDGGLLLEVAGYPSDEVRRKANERGVRVEEPLVEPDGHALDEAAQALKAGALTVNVRQTFPLEQAAAAHEMLERGGVRGKLVLEVGHD